MSCKEQRACNKLSVLNVELVQESIKIHGEGCVELVKCITMHRVGK